MKVSVFGNQDLKEDSLAVRVAFSLKEKFPEIEFQVEDPVEGLKPPLPGELWVILDVAKGVVGVQVVEDLDQLTAERYSSVHDYGVAMELKWLKKIGKAGEIKIIAIEMGMKQKEAEAQVGQALRKILLSVIAS